MGRQCRRVAWRPLPRGQAGSEERPVFSVGLCCDVCSAAPCPRSHGGRDGTGLDVPTSQQGHPSALGFWFLLGWRLCSPQEGTWGDGGCGCIMCLPGNQKHSKKSVSGKEGGKGSISPRASGLGFLSATLSGESCSGCPLLSPEASVPSDQAGPVPQAARRLARAVTTGDVSARGRCFDDKEEERGAVATLASEGEGASGC